MPTLVQVGEDEIEFPDSMSDADIESAVRKLYAPPEHSPVIQAQPVPEGQPYDDGFDVLDKPAPVLSLGERFLKRSQEVGREVPKYFEEIGGKMVDAVKNSFWNPSHIANLAKQDLRQTGDLANRVMASTAENSARVVGGALRLEETAGKASRAILGDNISSLIPYQGISRPPEVTRGLREFMGQVQTESRPSWDTSATASTVPEKLAEGVGSLIPAIASGGAAAPYTMALLGGESQAQDAQRAKADEATQLKAFGGGAALGFISEKLMGLPALLKSAKAAGASPERMRAIVQEVAKGAGREGIQEGIEQFGTNLIAKELYNPNQDLLEGVEDSMVVGALLGSGMGGVATAAQPPPETVEPTARVFAPPPFPSQPPPIPPQEQAANAAEEATVIRPATPVQKRSLESLGLNIRPMDQESFERRAGETLEEGNVAYEDPVTLQVFQVPQNATPEEVEGVFQSAREEEEAAIRKARLEEYDRQVDAQRFAEAVQQVPDILEGSAAQPIPQNPTAQQVSDEPLLNNLPRLKQMRDEMVSQNAKAKSGKLTVGGERVPFTPASEKAIAALNERISQLEGPPNVSFVQPESAKKLGDVQVEVDVPVFDQSFQSDPSYIQPGGEGVEGRRSKFEKFLGEGKPIETPEVSVDEKGKVTFTNGRHRYSVLRDRGQKTMPVSMSPESVENARKAGLLAGNPSSPTQQAPGASNIQELQRTRNIFATDVLTGLQASGANVDRPTWERNFLRQYPELSDDLDALDTAWAVANEAAARSQPGKPVPSSVDEVLSGIERPGEITSIKNAQASKELQEMGLSGFYPPTTRGWEMVQEEAVRRNEAEPQAVDEIVQRMRENPSDQLSDVEEAMLQNRRIEIRDRYVKAMKRQADAAAKKDSNAELVAKNEADSLRPQMTELYDILNRAGTNTARALAFRRAMVRDDYSIERMVAEMQSSKGDELTPDEVTQVQDWHDEIQKTETQFDARVDELRQEDAEKASEETFKDLQKEASQDQEIEPEVKGLLDRILARLKTSADAARARIRGRLGKLSAGLDPTILYDLSIIGAEKIANGIRKFSRWSAEMISEFGNDIEPYLQPAWDESQKRLDEQVESSIPDSAKKTEKVKKAKKAVETLADQKDRIVSGLQERIKEGESIKDLRSYIQKLALNFVRSGTKTRQELLDQVHGVVSPLVPDLTKEQTRDLISGYGDFKPLDQDAAKVTLRDIKGQLQQVAKLEAIQSKKPLQKTGVERRPMSDEERRLTAQVNEAKRKYGVVVTDPAKQLKGALDAVKTRLKNQIKDLTTEIDTGSKPPNKTPVLYDQEAEVLRGIRDRVRQTLADIEGPTELTDAQRIQIAKRGLETSIKEYERRIKQEDTSPKTRRATPSTPELEALKARRDALKAEYAELVALDTDRAEQIALKSLKTRLANRNAELLERIARKDFAPKARKEFDISKDPEAVRLRAENAIIKKEFAKQKYIYEQAQRTAWKRRWDTTVDALNAGKSIKTSMDFSAVLRQGGIISFAHPFRASAAFKEMKETLKSPHKAEEAYQRIMMRPNGQSGLYDAAGLYLAEPGDVNLANREEMFRSDLAEKIPGVGLSNRAFAGYLNRLRADSFDAMVAGLVDGTPTKEQLNAIANYINVATGRGVLGQSFERAADGLAQVFFSPRLVASRIQYLAGQPFYRGDKATRKIIAKEYGRTIAGAGLVIASLAYLMGGEIEKDPRSSDFGKIKIGKTRLDPLMGLGQITVLLARTITGENKSIKSGEILPFRKTLRPLDYIRGPLLNKKGKVAEPGFADRDYFDVLTDFGRTKFAPLFGATVNILTGENVIGEEAVAFKTTDKFPGIGGEIPSYPVPMSFGEIIPIMKDAGMTKGAIINALTILGMGAQVHEEKQKPKNKDSSTKLQGFRQKKEDRMPSLR